MGFINKIKEYKKYIISSMVVILVSVFFLLPSDAVIIEVEEIIVPEIIEPVLEEVIIEEEPPLEIETESPDYFYPVFDYDKYIEGLNLPVYREVPPMVDPNFFIQPDGILAWQAGYISRWDKAVNLHLPFRPELDLLLVLSVIGQESQGDEKLVSYDPDFLNNSLPGVGLMMISPRSWTGTVPWLLLPINNISVGTFILNSTIRDASEVHNFAPGLDSVRAGLAAYNCGWTSLLANKCYWFGGWAYADKVLLYWYPMLLERYEGEFEVPDYFKDIEL